MEEYTIEIGTILKNTQTETRYRIISLVDEFVIVCQMDTTITNVFELSINYVYTQIEEGNYTVENERPLYVDVSKLSHAAFNKYNLYMKILNAFIHRYGPYYESLMSRNKNFNVYHDLNRTEISSKTFWKIVRQYLQSGFNQYSVIDKREISHKNEDPYQYIEKTGRKNTFGPEGIVINDEIKKQFDESVELYKSGRQKSIQTVYDKMIAKYYCEIINDGTRVRKVPLPMSQRPTYNQLYYYLSKHITPEEKIMIKTSRQEYRNNNRLLDGDSLMNVNGPGYLVEMDTVETNVSLVSEIDDTVSIGRANVYAMIDVYTRVILAISVGIENNSTQGFINTMINLGEDKVDYCKRFGITITKEQWPSNIIPINMRFDRGADYKSQKVKQILNELGISRNLVPGASGSLKGIIEQTFHQLDRSYASQMEGLGYIVQRHDSKHHEQAALTIKDFTKLVINFVIAHNAKYMKSYDLDLDMMKNKIEPSPITLWNYGNEVYGNLRPITKNIAKQYAYSLMTDIKGAKLGREGIIVDGLIYANPSDTFLQNERIKLGNKKDKFICRMDLQNVGKIYYLRNNEIETATLSKKNKSHIYDGMSRKEYLAIKDYKKYIDWKNKQQEQETRSNLYIENEAVIDEAVAKRKGKAKATKKPDMDARRETKELLAKENDIMARLVTEDNLQDDYEDNIVLDEDVIDIDESDETTIVDEPKERLTPQEALARYRAMQEW